MYIMNVLIVLNYNDIENTERYVEKVRLFDCIDKIIVVDNNSSDNSSDRLELLKKYVKIEILYVKQNLGYAQGNNVALEYAYKNYEIKNFIISNPDIEISESSLEKILNVLDGDEYVVSSGLIYNKDNSVAKNYAWKLPTYVNILTEKFLITNYIAKQIGKSRYYERSLKEIPKEVEVISGCFFAIKAQKFKEVGFFCKDTFLYYEENILFYKLAKKNYRSAIVKDAPIIHYGGTSTKKNITSFFKIQKIHSESEKFFIMNCLKKKRYHIFLYNFIYNIGKYEKYSLLKVFNKI